MLVHYTAQTRAKEHKKTGYLALHAIAALSRRSLASRAQTSSIARVIH